MACLPNPISLPGTVSISTDATAGVMAKMKSIAYPNAKDHASTEQAFTNGFSDPGSVVSLLGFGQPGVLFTGAGSGQTQYIGTITAGGVRSNFKYIKKVVDSLSPKRASELWLAGCNTGTGNDGKQLLIRLANLLGIPVSAPFGFIFPDAECGRLCFQEGTGWLTVQPDSDPKSITTRFPPEVEQLSKDFIIIRNNGLSDDDAISSSLVRGISLQTSRFHAEWDDSLVKAALSHVHFDQPLYSGFPAPAVQTGTILLTLGRPTGGTSYRQFRLLNHYFVQDISYPQIYYPVNFNALVSTLMLS
jgi:hypothetical protein